MPKESRPHQLNCEPDRTKDVVTATATRCVGLEVDHKGGAMLTIGRYEPHATDGRMDARYGVPVLRS